MRLQTTLFFCLILCTLTAQAQNREFQASITKGNIWRATPKLADVFGHPNIATFGVNYAGFGERDWADAYPGIRSGAEISFIDFDNARLGKSVGISTFVALRVPYTRNAYAKFSGGANWVSNPYDPQENPGNPALGGPWSFNMLGHLYYEVEFWNGYVIRPGIALHHLSSCSYFQPNTGINVPAVFLEVGNRLPRGNPGKKPIPGVHRPGWDLLLQVGGSRKAEKGSGNKRFWVTSASAGALRRLTLINKLGMEITFINSQADRYSMQRKVTEGVLPQATDYKRFGVALHHELVFGKVSFYNALGYYVYNPAGFKKSWYQRYGVRYSLLKNLVFSPTMVAHLGTADFFELSLGYRLSTNNAEKS